MVYRARFLRNSAIFQIVCGSLMILLGIGSIFVVHHWSTYAGFGVWVGFWVRKDINLMEVRVIFRVDSNAKYICISAHIAWFRKKCLHISFTVNAVEAKYKLVYIISKKKFQKRRNHRKLNDTEDILPSVWKIHNKF